jgi:hypothetical protein
MVLGRFEQVAVALGFRLRAGQGKTQKPAHGFAA